MIIQLIAVKLGLWQNVREHYMKNSSPTPAPQNAIESHKNSSTSVLKHECN
jgi:hypothetical protein